MKRPFVVVVANRATRKDKLIDYVGEFHLELLVRLGVAPVIVPVVAGTLACLPQYKERMDGLLLVEGDDVEPKRFAARKANFQYVEKTLPLKDEIEVRLLRHALRSDVPILGICRGSQLLNVVSGGTLYGDVQKEIQKEDPNGPSGNVKSSLRHIEQAGEHYDTYRHGVTIVEGTPLRRWYGKKTLQVNSYHHQGIRDLAARFK